jgi:hypothetical protein
MRLLLLVAVMSIAGCATYRPPLVLHPVEGGEARTFFSNGQPIAVVEMPGTPMLLAASPETVAGHEYLRVWWLCRNDGDSTMLLEPLSSVRVTSRHTMTGDTLSATPEAPSRILHRIRNEEAVRAIAQAIGGAIEAASGERSATVRAEDAILRTRLASELYAHSVNSGVLRRNTLLPGHGVHGYVYVPFEGYVTQTRGLFDTKVRSPAPIEEFDHVVAVSVGARTTEVRFTMRPGE